MYINILLNNEVTKMACNKQGMVSTLSDGNNKYKVPTSWLENNTTIKVVDGKNVLQRIPEHIHA